MMLKIIKKCCRWWLSREVNIIANLTAENLALRQQLIVLKRNKTRPKLKERDRLFWVLLSRIWTGGERSRLPYFFDATRRSTGAEYAVQAEGYDPKRSLVWTASGRLPALRRQICDTRSSCLFGGSAESVLAVMARNLIGSSTNIQDKPKRIIATHLSGGSVFPRAGRSDDTRT